MFSEDEIRFLLKPHRVETADRNYRSLAASADLRTLGCPASIFNCLLEDRARRLGPKFAEFRNQQVASRREAAPSDDLDTRVASSRLF